MSITKLLKNIPDGWSIQKADGAFVVLDAEGDTYLHAETIAELMSKSANLIGPMQRRAKLQEELHSLDSECRRIKEKMESIRFQMERVIGDPDLDDED